MRFCFLVLATFSALNAEKVGYDKVPDTVLNSRLESVQKKNPDRKDTLLSLFQQAGCQAELVERKAKGSKLPNVICTIPGITQDLIIVGAHFDKVSAGMGAIDNWTGASLLPSLYESYRKMALVHTIMFIGFTDEESGLVGSKAFVKELTKEEIARVKALVNIDSIGTGPIHVWAKRAHRPFSNLAALVGGSMKIEVSAMDVDRVGDTDSHPFVDKRIPVIDFHSLDNTSIRLLHTDKDVLTAVDRARYREAYAYLSVFLGILDQRMEKLF